jgi:hypothetical protein
VSNGIEIATANIDSIVWHVLTTVTNRKQVESWHDCHATAIIQKLKLLFVKLRAHQL